MKINMTVLEIQSIFKNSKNQTSEVTRIDVFVSPTTHTFDCEINILFLYEINGLTVFFYFSIVEYCLPKFKKTTDFKQDQITSVKALINLSCLICCSE